MNLSTPRSTAELLTCPATAGKGALTTAEPITQAISRTEMMLTTAPPMASTNATGRHVTRERTAAPAHRPHDLPAHGGKKTHNDANRPLPARPLDSRPGNGGEKNRAT